MIVHAMEPVTLIGGAAIESDALERALHHAPRVIAADGGADTALEHGVVPEAVIGDFDSIGQAARESLPQAALHLIDEQDSTDFDKCLRNITAPLILGVGFSGARPDHAMAAFNTLVRHPTRRCVLLGGGHVVFLAPPALRLDVGEGCPLSLFPMGAVEGVSDGLRWPIGGVNFAPDGRVGTSNQTEGEVHLSLTAPKMLVILPDSALDASVQALLQAPARWP